MKLTREVRCFPFSSACASHENNTWAGIPERAGREPFWIIRVTIQGPIDNTTGYICDIRLVDKMVRDTVVPTLQDCLTQDDTRQATVECGLQKALGAAKKLSPTGCTVDRLEIAVSPFLTYAIRSGDSKMVRLTQSFEFSAAHRLYCEKLDEAENLRVFGKCSNPHGHGHNYVVDVTLEGHADDSSGTIVDLPLFNGIVHERVILYFDHKNLNVECAEFSALNPSVENIARVIWQRLEGAFDRCRVASIRVWETPKTCAEYTGE